MNFQEELLRQGLSIPYEEDAAVLREQLSLYGRRVPNRIGILPLEGFDSAMDGSPTDSVYRRYLRFVEGGAGLIWFEACAVSEDGKSNPGQMMLTDGNVPAFRELLQAMDEKAESLGREAAFKVIQLTHSGRLSRDNSWNRIPFSPKNHGEKDNARLATDEQIEKLVRDHIHSARLAKEAGFDAVDIKVCHGYFLCELLSAFQRTGRYGGSFENRTRALFDIIDGIREQLGDTIGISVRLNAYDSVPYPYGFAVVTEDGRKKPDLTETVRLCELLRDKGVTLINISASSPRERLFGPEPTDERYKKYSTSCDYLQATKYLREHVPGIAFMCTGLTSFGAHGGQVAAGGVRDGWFDIAGFGRQALAYPGFASDILSDRGMQADRICVNCFKCYSLMDPGHCRTGCIVRDREEFYPLYQRNVLGEE